MRLGGSRNTRPDSPGLTFSQCKGDDVFKKKKRDRVPSSTTTTTTMIHRCSVCACNNNTKNIRLRILFHFPTPPFFFWYLSRGIFYLFFVVRILIAYIYIYWSYCIRCYALCVNRTEFTCSCTSRFPIQRVQPLRLLLISVGYTHARAPAAVRRRIQIVIDSRGEQKNNIVWKKNCRVIPTPPGTPYNPSVGRVMPRE